MRSLRFAHQLNRPQVLAFFAGALALAVATGAALGLHPQSFARLDHLWLDGLLRTTARAEPARHTVVVDIDEVSLAAVGQWPWPRYQIADLVQRIAEAAPAAVALDIVFPEPDRSSLNTLRQRYERDFGLTLGISGVPASLQDNDGYLGRVLARTGAVGAHYLYFDHRTAGTPGAAEASALPADPSFARLDLPRASGVMANTPAVDAGLAHSGFINNRVDDDGQLRRVPLLIEHDGRVHPSLALAAVLKARGAAGAAVVDTPDGPRLRVGAVDAPIDARGQALLRTSRSVADYPAVSAVDVLNGQVPASALAGRIVFMGSSAVGLNDVHHTAIAPRFPGLRIQAAIAENLLEGSFVRSPVWATAAAAALAASVALAMAAIFAAGRSGASLLLGGLFVGLLPAAGSVLLFVQDGLVVSPAAPTVVAALMLLGGFAGRYGIERRRASTWLRQLENAREITIESMASVAETRDPETGAHLKRTQHYVRAIALELRRTGHHRATLTPDYIELLFISAPLHDIGKVGVPDHILLKPGKLTPDEMEQMKRHADYGRQILIGTARRIDGENFLTIAAQIAGGHHEKWDGSGYPRGLAGEDIPLAARIMAVADVYDALISRRCYKPAFSHAHATQLMRDLSGTAFDPQVLEAFFAIEPQILAIAARFRDEDDVKMSFLTPTAPVAAVPTPMQAPAALPPSGATPVLPLAH
ncbi:CHASE2 domain-containing protein [Pseudacidovorax intermedius]|uniref:CHASE2 domain-containing protein n=1 Tax=Pseudacidovorax intermedius TaxID=433924 RepID=UPI0009E98C43|nr:CHASE2 domain-containing protein [Pseudacidovorax intermedius]